MANIPEGASAHLKAMWAEIPKQKEFIDVLKYNQTTRGAEGLQSRMAERAATHTSWRQMKGMERVMFEVNHPGNRPFVIGFVLTTTTLMYTYFSSLGSPSAEAQSKYWQRFHAKKTDGH